MLNNIGPKPKALVLDIGEVLVRLDFSAVMKLRGFAPEQSLGQWLKSMNSWDLYDSFERGDLDEIQFLAQLCKNLKLNLSKAQFLEAWNTVLRTTVTGAENLVTALKGEILIYGLTNSNESHIRHFFLTST